MGRVVRGITGVVRRVVGGVGRVVGGIVKGGLSLVGKVAKFALPIAGLAAPFLLPGVGGALTGLLGKFGVGSKKARRACAWLAPERASRSERVSAADRYAPCRVRFLA